MLTRHTNALALVFLPLYGVTSLVSARAAFAHLHQNVKEVMIILAVAGLAIAPQLAMYYRATGRILVSPYGRFSFNFDSPHLFGVLFSVQKGVFFWSPILALGIAGLFMARDRARSFVMPAVVFLTFDTFLIASWWDWQFGASYGHRGFVDTLPVLAIGVGAFFDWSARRGSARALVTVVATALTTLSVFQMFQYWNGVLPTSDTTWEQYRSVVLRMP